MSWGKLLARTELPLINSLCLPFKNVQCRVMSRKPNPVCGTLKRYTSSAGPCSLCCNSAPCYVWHIRAYFLFMVWFWHPFIQFLHLTDEEMHVQRCISPCPKCITNKQWSQDQNPGMSDSKWNPCISSIFIVFLDWWKLSFVLYQLGMILKYI